MTIRCYSDPQRLLNQEYARGKKRTVYIANTNGHVMGSKYFARNELGQGWSQLLLDPIA